LFELFIDLADAVAEPVVLVKDFLGTLPGAKILKDKELPQGTILEGFVEEAGKKIRFRFEEVADQVKVTIEKNSPFESLNKATQWVAEHTFVGSWAEATEYLTDKLSPGDKLMSIGIEREEMRYFSYADAKS